MRGRRSVDDWAVLRPPAAQCMAMHGSEHVEGQRLSSVWGAKEPDTAASIYLVCHGGRCELRAGGPAPCLSVLCWCGRQRAREKPPRRHRRKTQRPSELRLHAVRPVMWTQTQPRDACHLVVSAALLWQSDYERAPSHQSKLPQI